MKILITGSHGLLGTSIKKNRVFFLENEYIFTNKELCDLRNHEQTLKYFNSICKENIDIIIHCASNTTKDKVSMFTDNVRINENVLEACRINGIKKGIFLLNSFVYSHYPNINNIESDIKKGTPSSTDGYTYAKKMLEMQCRMYNQKYNCQYICIISPVLFGQTLSENNIINHLISKFYNANKKNEDIIVPHGNMCFQFIYSDDLAYILLKIIKEWDHIIKFINLENNICINVADQVYTIDEIIDEIIDKLVTISEINPSLVKTDPDNYYFTNYNFDQPIIDCSRLYMIFDTIQFTSLQDALLECYLFYKKNVK